MRMHITSRAVVRWLPMIAAGWLVCILGTVYWRGDASNGDPSSPQRGSAGDTQKRGEYTSLQAALDAGWNSSPAERWVVSTGTAVGGSCPRDTQSLSDKQGSVVLEQLGARLKAWQWWGLGCPGCTGPTFPLTMRHRSYIESYVYVVLPGQLQRQ
jgi:hypothetical protein